MPPDSAPAWSPTPAQIDAVRAFNRLWTARIGVLGPRHLASRWPLAAVRVLYEVAHARDDGGTPLVARDLAARLALDAGYLSRLLRSLEEAGLLTRTREAADARRATLALTGAGRRLARDLEARSRDEIAALLAPLGRDAGSSVVDALTRVRTSLVAPVPARAAVPFVLRAHVSGDMGWVIARHGALYAEEYGWDITFEALVARIAADFITQFDPRTDRCWIAERAGPDGRATGERIGCVFAVRHPERPRVTKLRLLLVEPSARGLGLGARLVREVTAFARGNGSDALTLWTNSVLVSARRLYEAEGYRLVREAPHHSFGADLVEQTWELDLRGATSRGASTPRPRAPRRAR
ncbi:MAG: MarR family transcriptional regulator [Gemmatimonadetes bacterium]|nr:MarR family transcriptional regulator [Gemmatimonadota bacterium]